MNSNFPSVSASISALRGTIDILENGSVTLSQEPGLATDLVNAVIGRNVADLTVDEGALLVDSVGVTHETAVSDPISERTIAVDQTNLSIVVDERFIVKVVTRCGNADQAAHQLARLARAGSVVAPPYLGSVDWDPGTGEPHAIALVSRYLPGTEDGWSWAVDDVLSLVAGGLPPTWPRQLGELCAQLHSDLSREVESEQHDVVAPYSARPRAEAALTEALELTAGSPGIRLRNRIEPIKTAIATLPDDLDSPLIPIHGDLHVGQFLRTPDADADADEYWIIDFDGDPQLNPSDREQPDAPARDVAHMLTSIDLVAAVAQRRLGRSDPALFEWAMSAQQQFLEAYRARLATHGLARLLDDRLLEGFIAEQLLRELIYAGRFLPRWAYAPDAVITFRYPNSHAQKEEPWSPPDFSTT